MIPGEILAEPGNIELNAGRTAITLQIINTGDRPIQVGSHYHFAETNQALQFDRQKARGMRLNIISGTAVRFEPGQVRTIELIAVSGDRKFTVFTDQSWEHSNDKHFTPSLYRNFWTHYCQWHR